MCRDHPLFYRFSNAKPDTAIRLVRMFRIRAVALSWGMSYAPRVSVVIPTHNRAAAVVRAVQSVLDQTFRPLEVIVVIDGSTDDTAEVLAANFGSFSWVRVIEQPNRGQAAARNAGVDAARGDWIAFLDDDDFWRSERLQRFMAALEQFPDMALHACNALIHFQRSSAVQLFDLRNQPYSHFSCAVLNSPDHRPLVDPTEYVMRGYFFLQTAIFRRDLLMLAGEFRSIIYEDLDLFVRCIPLGGWVLSRSCEVEIDRLPGENVSAEWRTDPARRATLAAIQWRAAKLAPTRKGRVAARKHCAGTLCDVAAEHLAREPKARLRPLTYLARSVMVAPHLHKIDPAWWIVAVILRWSRWMPLPGDAVVR